ncbi:MAG: arginine--tRNA ligase [Puniceicoccales bacterium]|jgi:arginyl-tRNA synthetase|nr:arginine--tRNA ligase [Puniceicoccales bacterium]
MGIIAFDLQRHLEDRVTAIGRDRCGFGENFQAQVQPAEARFGDFQVNGVLPYGKVCHKNPRALAQQLLEATERDAGLSGALARLEVAGAGFVNLTLSEFAVNSWLQTYASAAALRGAADSWAGRRVVVDYAGPNSAKQMHVGHLRSLVIGDALQRILAFCGATVVRDNHIGDWGTQFGILLRQIRVEGIDLDAISAEDSLELLENLYRRGVVASQTSPEVLGEARAELAALQGNDKERRRLWERINALSYASFQEIYDLAAVKFDVVLGESFYRDMVERVYGELLECGIARKDGGALVVFHPEHGCFCRQPFLIRKSDGASNYASTDLATVLYRVEHFAADDIIYVTDARQRDHFEQLFLTVEKWFRAKNYPLPRLRHVWFGTVCGEDGKAIKTRSGEPVRLKGLFDGAIGRALAALDAKDWEFDGVTRREIARVVGVGALKYGDLSQNRSSDYVFSLEKMLSLEGNTSPYLQYAVARIHAIFRRVPAEAAGWRDYRDLSPRTPEESTLVRRLVQFPIALRQTVEDLRPHLLCGYLYALAGDFSTFYGSNRIFDGDPAAVARRLVFCDRTLLFLETGLHLLGIETLERM